VPAGTTLTAYTGPCTITTANTVIDARTVNCSLIIRTTGVQITRSRVNGSVSNGTETNTSFLIADSEIVASPNTTSVGEVNFVVVRSELRGGNRGGNCYSACTIRDSWIHGQRITGETHASGLRAGMDTTYVHNTIGCDVADTSQQGGCSASLTMYPDFSPVTRVLIEGNLIMPTPGYYCAYGGATTGKPYSGDPANATYIRFLGNTFARGPSGHCGGPRDGGPITSYAPNRTGNQWSGNVWDTDGAPVNP